jgi:hypothetical protein
MPNEKCITIGFSTHRPETVPLAAKYMQRHEAIILEEPENPDFRLMLSGEMAIDDYLIDNDFEFPEFSRKSCELYRSLYEDGKQLFQIDPYMARLNAIRDIFDQGGKANDINPNSTLGPVYAVERSWTAALLAYYENCLTAPFAEVVEFVKHFAREDAARGRLRDELRAQAIYAITPSFNSLYIEAGTLHISLFNRLKDLLQSDYQLRQVYLTSPIVQRICGRHHSLGPGDKLTLYYTYRPDFVAARADLLAAQSLIQSKIQLKDEIIDAAYDFPHTLDEVKTAALVSRLSYSDCNKLYDEIKNKSTLKARVVVQDFLNMDTM